MFKLLEHAFQLLDLDVALMKIEEDRTVTQQRLFVLLETAQLENEADAVHEEAERHQEDVQWSLAPAQQHDDNLGDMQSAELQSLIQDLYN